MTVEGARPRVENSARGLGVRVGGGTNTDIPIDSAGKVAPGTGGMSVGPTWRDLPVHRIPRRLKHMVPAATGNNNDACWTMGNSAFIAGPLAEGLLLRPDNPTHGLVEPAREVQLDVYLGDLASTRNTWIIDES
jgi:hypothetical protein